MAGLRSMMAEPDFVFEIREHIAFCSRHLPHIVAEEQAAIMLKEVLGFTAQEAGQIMEISEPISGINCHLPDRQ